MSESVGGGGAASVSGAGSVSASDTSTNTSDMGSPQGALGESGSQGESPAERQERLLGEQDLDAFVEHTVNGKKERVKVRDALKGYGLEKAANEKMRTAAEERKRFQAEMKRLESLGIEDFAKMRGIDIDSLAEERLARKYEEAQLSPEERQIKSEREELARIKQMEMSSKQSIAKQIEELTGQKISEQDLQRASKEQLINYYQKQQGQQAQEMQSLEQEFIQAWESQGLPKHKSWGIKIAHELFMDGKKRAQAEKNGEIIDTPPLQAKDAAAKVKKQWLSEVSEVLGTMDAGTLQQTLGKEIIQKLMEHEVGRVTNQASFGTQNRPASSQAASGNTPKQVNEVEWRKLMGLQHFESKNLISLGRTPRTIN